MFAPPGPRQTGRNELSCCLLLDPYSRYVSVVAFPTPVRGRKDSGPKRPSACWGPPSVGRCGGWPDREVFGTRDGPTGRKAKAFVSVKAPPLARLERPFTSGTVLRRPSASGMDKKAACRKGKRTTPKIARRRTLSPHAQERTRTKLDTRETEDQPTPSKYPTLHSLSEPVKTQTVNPSSTIKGTTPASPSRFPGVSCSVGSPFPTPYARLTPLCAGFGPWSDGVSAGTFSGAQSDSSTRHRRLLPFGNKRSPLCATLGFQ